MIIEQGRKEDIPRLTDLWQEAFGDSREFIGKFFRTGFAPERSAVADGGAGALYWFDCLWKGKKIAYIYAVATEKKSRGKGICGKLMAYTHQVLKDRGYAGAILVPAEESLSQMYGKMGYIPLKKAVILSASEESPKHSKDSATEISAEEYMRLREKLLPEGAVHHTEKAFSYMAEFMKFYRFDGGILCGDVDDPAEVLPGGKGEQAMYIPFDGDEELPTYFSLGMG